MPLLELSLWNSPGVLPSLIGKAPSSVAVGNWNIVSPTWKPFRNQNFPCDYKISHGKSFIKAAISLKARSLVRCEDGPPPPNIVPSSPASDTQTLSIESSGMELKDLDKEQLRRMKISAARRGKTPWNKGRKHSPETIQRIREKTRLALQNPMVKLKMQKAYSKEHNAKRAIAVREGMQRRRQKLMIQETCYYQWQNQIAETARGGLAGEDELQWDSYDILNKLLEQEWLESKEKRKLTPKRTEPKSLEQRNKIAASVAARWADPEYRQRVSDGMAKYFGTIAALKKAKRQPPSLEKFQLFKGCKD